MMGQFQSSLNNFSSSIAKSTETSISSIRGPLVELIQTLKQSSTQTQSTPTVIVQDSSGSLINASLPTEGQEANNVNTLHPFLLDRQFVIENDSNRLDSHTNLPIIDPQNIQGTFFSLEPSSSNITVHAQPRSVTGPQTAQTWGSVTAQPSQGPGESSLTPQATGVHGSATNASLASEKGARASRCADQATVTHYLRSIPPEEARSLVREFFQSSSDHSPGYTSSPASPQSPTPSEGSVPPLTFEFERHPQNCTSRPTEVSIPQAGPSRPRSPTPPPQGQTNPTVTSPGAPTPSTTNGNGKLRTLADMLHSQFPDSCPEEDISFKPDYRKLIKSKFVEQHQTPPPIRFNLHDHCNEIFDHYVRKCAHLAKTDRPLHDIFPAPQSIYQTPNRPGLNSVPTVNESLEMNFPRTKPPHVIMPLTVWNRFVVNAQNNVQAQSYLAWFLSLYNSMLEKEDSSPDPELMASCLQSISLAVKFAIESFSAQTVVLKHLHKASITSSLPAPEIFKQALLRAPSAQDDTLFDPETLQAFIKDVKEHSASRSQEELLRSLTRWPKVNRPVQPRTKNRTYSSSSSSDPERRQRPSSSYPTKRKSSDRPSGAPYDKKSHQPKRSFSKKFSKPSNFRK